MAFHAIGSQPRGTAQRLFHHRLEALVAGRALLPEVVADSIQVVLLDRLLQPIRVEAAASRAVGMQCKKPRMRGDERIIDQREVGMDAGPAVLFGAHDHRGRTGFSSM